MKVISERVYYMDAEAETDQPFVFYIRGDTFCILVDAGNSPAKVKKLYRELEEAGLKKPDLAVLTHWHWDHTFGVCALNCPVIGSQETDQILRRVQTWKWDEASMKERLKTGEDILFTYGCMKKQYPSTEEIHVCRPNIVFQNGLVIDAGGITCRLIHRDSPHTRDAVFIFLPEENILIGGDAHYEDYYDNDSRYDKGRLESFISWLEPLPFQLYLKGHDEPALTKQDLLELLYAARTAV